MRETRKWPRGLLKARDGRGTKKKPLLFRQTLRSRFTCLTCQHFSFYARKSLDRERPFSLVLRVVSLFSCFSCLAPSVTCVVICVSRAFFSMDQEKSETARSLNKKRTETFPFAFSWVSHLYCRRVDVCCHMPAGKQIKTFFVVVLNGICLLIALNVRVKTLRENYSCNYKH